MIGYCLDAGALIAIERGSRVVDELVDRVLRSRGRIDVPAGVLAQVWRGGPRQARLARFIATPDLSVVELDEWTARTIGELCAARGTSDVVDAHVALHAYMEDLAVITSDPDDIAAFGPLEIIAI